MMNETRMRKTGFARISIRHPSLQQPCVYGAVDCIKSNRAHRESVIELNGLVYVTSLHITAGTILVLNQLSSTD